MTVVSRTVAPPWGRESQGQRGVQDASIWMAACHTALLLSTPCLRQFSRTRKNMLLALAVAKQHTYSTLSLQFACYCAS